MPDIKDTEQIYNTDDLVNSTTSQSLVNSALKEKNYAEEKKQKENVFIIEDSMVQNVNAFKLTGMVDQRCIVKKRDFSSAKISCMKDYIKSTLRELNPEHVILHVGTLACNLACCVCYSYENVLYQAKAFYSSLS